MDERYERPGEAGEPGPADETGEVGGTYEGVGRPGPADETGGLGRQNPFAGGPGPSDETAARPEAEIELDPTEPEIVDLGDPTEPD